MTESEVVIQSGSTVGQTFVAENAGLDGLLIFLDPEGDLSGEVRLHLRSDSEAKNDRSQAVISADQITQAGNYLFEFDPQADSFRKYYYAFLEYEGTGLIWVGNAQAESYLDGALYVDHHPVDRQMGFQLTYHPGYRALGFLRELLYWFVILLAAIFLFVVPGFSILTLLLPDLNKLRWSARIVLGIGISLSLYPILFLLTYLVNIKIGAILTWIPGLIGSGILLRKAATCLRYSSLREKIRLWFHSENLLPDLITFLILAAIIGVRFFIIRTVDLPLWGDSLTHSMVAQLIVDNGGLFQSWVPYAELQSFTYHFGFHTLTAVFHWLTKIPVPQSTLWVGQILNILAVLGLYPIAEKISGFKWAGISSIVIAGLIISMPNFYTNWGRYTQLAGQAILPAIIILAWYLRDKRQIQILPSVVLGSLMGGLSLMHYRVLIFAIIFIFIIVIDGMIRSRHIALAVNFAISTLTGVFVFLPWLSSMIGGRILGNALDQISTPANAVSNWIQEYNLIGNLSVYLPSYIWVAMIGCGLWAVLRRDKYAATIVAWWMLLLIAANPQLLGLPGQGVLSNFAVFIAMYIPAGLLIGSAVGWILATKPILARSMPILITLLAFFGGISRLGDLDPEKHALATRPDIHAWAWIENNLPIDAKFLPNSFFAFGGTIVVGSDGGWWLPLMTRRQSSLPPISYGVEKGPRVDNIHWQNEIVRQIQRGGINDIDSLGMIRDREISHIYVGQQQGSVNSSGLILLDPDLLSASSFFKPIYHQDRVWIFEVIP